MFVEYGDNMKKVNVKDVNDGEISIKKPNNVAKIILIVVMIIVSMIGVFFASTYIRWNAFIEDKYEIIYYEQDGIKVDEVKGFYGEDLNNDLSENQAMRLYCTSQYGGKCVTGNYTDILENLFRSPGIIINIVILIDLGLLYLLVKEKKFNKIQRYIFSLLIVLYGIYGLGVQIYKMTDYYFFVNNSEYVTNGKIIKEVIPRNDKFKAIVSYDIGDKNYIEYLDYDIKGSFLDNNEKKVMLYYDKKDGKKIEVKRSLLGYILPIIIAILMIVIGYDYFKIKKKDNENNN